MNPYNYLTRQVTDIIAQAIYKRQIPHIPSTSDKATSNAITGTYSLIHRASFNDILSP